MKGKIPEHHVLIMQALLYLVPHNSEVYRDLSDKIESASHPEPVEKVSHSLDAGELFDANADCYVAGFIENVMEPGMSREKFIELFDKYKK